MDFKIYGHANSMKSWPDFHSRLQ